MWTILKEQMTAIELSMRREYILRVCRYISKDEEFAWMLEERINEEAERVLDKRMSAMFEDEKYAAEFVKLHIKHPEALKIPYSRDIRLILDDNDKTAKEKIDVIAYYVNN